MTKIFPGILPDAEDREAFEPVTEISDDEAATLERGNCPWCDEGPFDRPEMHAQQVHAEEWAAFKNDAEDA